ncbi:GNAT family N-acetyltransferase [Nesterenkonia sp. F]|uniref:GNAT family N-acetyltransferase n=1 Tax=Nesterenkonia sp. F TaxID=795955 RepID=UPI000255CE63|nr:GNAT family N-acetyltransferase [Nesterenkonia sp. F]
MDPDQLPALETDRLRLRAPTAEDVDFIANLYARPEVARFIGDGRTERTREQALARIERYRSFAGATTGVWLASCAVDGEPRGIMLLKPIPVSADVDPEPQPEIEIGWHLHPDAQGRGYAAEAAEALVEHARTVGLETLVAVAHPENRASHRVAERIGMAHRGTTDRYYGTTVELFTLEL